MYKLTDVVLLKTSNAAMVVWFLTSLVKNVRPKHKHAYEALVAYYASLEDAVFNEIMLTIEPRYRNGSDLTHAQLTVRMYVQGPGISCEVMHVPKHLLLFQEEQNDN